MQEASELIQLLKPHVDGFSQGFQLNNQREDEITCGGKVVSIVDTSLLDDKSQIVYVRLDDAVGEMLIMVPTETWRANSPKVGDVIIASGQLHKMTRQCVFKSKADTYITRTDDSEPLRLLTKSIKVISRLQE